MINREKPHIYRLVTGFWTVSKAAYIEVDRLVCGTRVEFPYETAEQEIMNHQALEFVERLNKK
ncbi:hypothetical protein MIS46_04180 [Wielerella bovis]|uniref:hypothetical protein n=1 Tax=Wielerella bovis TaxID=2917790 RepID=UPI0020195A96|nr:hypothetical protein [Wielerella bovis]ULJ61033.1 hypothetical protein MIS44_04045 [Wielerella bovis]ULJ63253.1 hypothetical protein MIS46_04180 [Wielerella bovis]